MHGVDGTKKAAHGAGYIYVAAVPVGSREWVKTLVLAKRPPYSPENPKVSEPQALNTLPFSLPKTQKRPQLWNEPWGPN